LPERSPRSYPREVRLLRKADFDRILRDGPRVGDRTMTLRGVPREDGGPTRLGITIGRKAGRAVVRNRTKRLIREAFRLSRESLPAGMDIVVFPSLRKGEQPPPMEEYRRSLLSLARQVEKRLSRPDKMGP
jgi:ribonuclease P protein component